MRAAIISVLATLSALGASQAGIPTCASNAALQGALSSGCQTTDVECLCKNTGFIDSIKSAISGSCTGLDAQAACAWGNSQCASYGVNLPCDSLASQPPNTGNSGAETPAATPDAGTTDTAAPPTSSGEAGGSSANASSNPAMGTATDSVTSAPAGTADAGTMSSGVGTMSTLSTMTTPSNAGNSSMTMTGNMTHSATMTATDSAPNSAYTGAAATSGAKQGGILGVVAGIALMFAFF